MAYDAVLPADADFSAGMTFLRRHGKDGVPFTCLNLVSARSGKPAFQPFRFFSRAGMRILLTGIVGEDVISKGHLPGSDWKVLPPQAALEALLAGKEASGADLVIILTHIGRPRDIALARAVNRPLLIFGAGSETTPASPAFETGAAIFQSREKGTHLLEVSVERVRRAGKTEWRGFADRDRIGQYREKRRRLLIEMDAMDAKRRSLYGKAVESLDNAIRIGEGKVPVSSRLIPLGSAVPDDPALKSMLSDYKAAVARIARESNSAGQHPSVYLGHAACSGCHARNFAAWRDEAHARAFETLRKTGDGGNPDCLGCHVTGYEAGGFRLSTPAGSSGFAGVGCEACHGPGKGHPGRRMAMPDGKTCARCHRNPAPFPFDGKRRLLGCVKASGGTKRGAEP